MSKVKAEMLAAYEWVCDSCGRNQFVSAVTADFVTDDDKLQFAKTAGLIDEFAEKLTDDLNGDFVTYPESVVCQHCGAEFETVYPGDEEDDG